MGERGGADAEALTCAERMVRSMPARRLRCSLRRRLESYSRIFLRAMARDGGKEKVLDWKVRGLVTGAGRAGCTLVSQREGRTEDGFVYIYREKIRGGFANAGAERCCLLIVCCNDIVHQQVTLFLCWKSKTTREKIMFFFF